MLHPQHEACQVLPSAIPREELALSPHGSLASQKKPELLQDQHAYKVVGGTADGALVGAIRECGVWQGRIA